MGLKNIFQSIFFVSMFVIFSVEMVYASWVGPVEVVSGVWGDNPGQFSIKYEDTHDVFPTTIDVSFNGTIAISEDQTLGRVQLYNESGQLKKIIDSFAYSLSFSADNFLYITGGGLRKYDPSGNLMWNKEGISYDVLYSLPNNEVIGYDRDKKIYHLYSATGQLLKTSSERPLELGHYSWSTSPSGGFIHTIKFPDRTYGFVLPWRSINTYQRDGSGNLVVAAQTNQKEAVYKINSCGKILGEMHVPESKWQVVDTIGRERVKELEYQYGTAVIAPNGDVYTWKRTPDTYSILKWTWVDDPNDPPSGPDAPTNLSVMPSTTGLYLTWTASPQDPGCVTGYEIARATSSGGVYSTVKTVEKGVVKYNDTSASAGTTYYYKVRAKAGSEYSNYTSEVSGKR